MYSLTKCLKDHRDIILVGHVIKSHEDESLFRGIDHIPIQSYWSDIVCQNTTPTSAPSGAWTHNLWNPLSLQLASIALITRPYRQDTHRYRMFVKQTRVAFTALSKIHITHFGKRLIYCNSIHVLDSSTATFMTTNTEIACSRIFSWHLWHKYAN